MMNVHQAIERAEALLPGEPIEVGEDPRWQAIIEIGYHIDEELERVWAFVERWGGHPQEDLRDAIACCLLEHLLEAHFELFFSRLEARALSDKLFADMFMRSWKMGESKQSQNSERWDALVKRLTS